jgi:hypothetical protein
MSALLQLAERCEKAVGADRELDLDITEALGLAGRSALSLVPFTASLDAAMKLVPEGWDWGAYFSPENIGIYPRAVGAAKCQGPHDGQFVMAQSATPALALCAAALRARAAS